MIKKIILSLSFLLLLGCSPESSYTDTLETWRDEESAMAYKELQNQYNQVVSELAGTKGKYLQNEAVNSQLKGEMEALQVQCSYLEYQLTLVPDPIDVTGYIKALQELANANNELREKFIDLMDLWEGMKFDYKELAEAFIEAVSTGNFTDNQTRDYINLIRVIE